MHRIVERIRTGFRSLGADRGIHEGALAELTKKLDTLEQKVSESSRQLGDLMTLSKKTNDLLDKFVTRNEKDADNITSKLKHIVYDLDFVRNHMSAYLGDDIALTYLNDRTPIFIDTRNPATAALIVNGGAYEEGNVETILSFVKPDSIFLDVGANIGLYSLKVAARIGDRGRVYAFEPQEKLAKLIRRSAFMNRAGDLHSGGKIACYDFGLSDKSGERGFRIPPDNHLGGGRVMTRRRGASFASRDSMIFSGRIFDAIW